MKIETVIGQRDRKEKGREKEKDRERPSSRFILGLFLKIVNVTLFSF